MRFQRGCKERRVEMETEEEEEEEEVYLTISCQKILSDLFLEGEEVV